MRQALSEEGFDGLSVHRIAVRSNTTATALRRRWGSTVELAQAVVDNLEIVDEAPDLGSVAKDLRAFFAPLQQPLTEDELAIAGVLGAMQHTAELAVSVRRVVRDQVMIGLSTIVDRYPAQSRHLQTALPSVGNLMVALWWQRLSDMSVRWTARDLDALTGALIEGQLVDPA